MLALATTTVAAFGGYIYLRNKVAVPTTFVIPERQNPQNVVIDDYWVASRLTIWPEPTSSFASRPISLWSWRPVEVVPPTNPE